MEIRELHNHLGPARDQHQKLIGLTTAVVAVLLSGATMLGNRTHVEEGKLQTRITDQWSFYASKHSAAHSLEADVEQAKLSGKLQTILAGHLNLRDQDKQKVADQIRAASQAQAEQFRATAEEEDRDSQQFKATAQELERQADVLSHSGDIYVLAELALQISVVLCSVSLLAESRMFWLLSFLSTVAGVGFIAYGLALR
jgi:Domain of unknown function (DUF4337)